MLLARVALAAVTLLFVGQEVAGCGAAQPKGEQATRHITYAQVANLTIPEPGDAPIRLRNAKAVVNYGGASSDQYSLAGFFAEGDLNGDGINDAAAVLVDDSPGSGTFYSLVPIVATDRGIRALAPIDLGDRVVLQQVAISRGRASVEQLDRGPSDTMTDLSQRSVTTYELAGGRLVEVGRTRQPLTQVPLPAPDPAPRSLAVSASPTDVTGRLKYGQSSGFVFAAQGGTRLDVDLTAPLGLFLSIHDTAGYLTRPDDRVTSWSGVLPRKGTWTVDVASLNGAVVPFTVTLSANRDTTPAPAPTSPTTTGKVAYLSFDDGPNPPYTQQMLAILKQYDATATFFVVGQNAARYRDLVAQEIADGNTVGNHTWDHASLAGMSQSQFDNEVLRTKKVMPAGSSDCLRPPYGATDAFTKQYAAALGYRVQLWDIDPRDWSRPGASSIVRNVEANIHPGAVILMHDGGGDRSESVAALAQILRDLTRQGWRFVAPC